MENVIAILEYFHNEEDIEGTTPFTVEDYQKAISKCEELELFKLGHLRLEAELNTILHPNGDGPTAPSFCDLVAFVRNDLKPKTCEGCEYAIFPIQPICRNCERGKTDYYTNREVEA